MAEKIRGFYCTKCNQWWKDEHEIKHDKWCNTYEKGKK